MNVLHGHDEQTYLYKHHQSICEAGTGHDRIDWYIHHRPNLSAKLIAIQCFSGNASMDNPRFVALVNRIAEAKEKAQPKAKPARKRGKTTRAS